MNCHPMPLMIVESHASRLNVHFLLAIRQAHRQRNSTITYRQIEIVGAVTCAKKVEEKSKNGLKAEKSEQNDCESSKTAAKCWLN